MPYIPLGEFGGVLREEFSGTRWDSLLSGVSVAKTFIIGGGTQGALRSENYNGAVGWSLFGDGTAFFGTAVTVAADLYSANWVSGGGTLPLSLPDSGAASGYALDHSAGTAQFQSIYAEGGQLENLLITGDLSLSTGGVFQAGTVGVRLAFSSSFGQAAMYAATDTAGISSGALTVGDDFLKLESSYPTAGSPARGSIILFPSDGVFVGSVHISAGSGKGSFSVGNNTTSEDTFYWKIGATEQARLEGDYFTVGPRATTGVASISIKASDTAKVSYGFNNDPNTGFLWDSADLFSAVAGAIKVQQWNVSGPAFENAVTIFPSWVSAAPATLSAGIVNNAYTALPSSTITLWTHGGTNRSVRVDCEGTMNFAYAGAGPINVLAKLGISLNGGSTWTYGNNPDGFVGSANGGAFRYQSVLLNSLEGTATGDVQARMEYFVVGATDPASIGANYIKGVAHQIF